MQQHFKTASHVVAGGIRLWKTFLLEDRGQDLVEYALLAGFVGIAGWAALSVIGPTMSATYSTWVSPTTGAPSLWEPADPWTSGS